MDGKWLEVDDQKQRVELPLPSDIARSIHEKIEVRTITYFAEYIKSAGATIKVFRFSGMTGTQTLAQLVRGYRS